MEENCPKILKKWLFTCWHPECGMQFYSDQKKRVIRNVVTRNHLQRHGDYADIHDTRFARALEYVGKTKKDWQSIVGKRKFSNLYQVKFF